MSSDVLHNILLVVTQSAPKEVAVDILGFQKCFKGKERRGEADMRTGN